MRISTLFHQFCNTLKNIVIKHTPLKKISSFKFPSWFSTDLINLIIEKKRLHHIYKESLDEHSYMECSRVRNQRWHMFRACYYEYVNYVPESTDHRAFWSFIKNTKRQDMSPTTMKFGDISTSKANEMRELFSSYFSSVFSTPSQPNINYNFDTLICLSKLFFTHSEVFEALEELDISKSFGPDLIPSSVLRYCTDLISC